MSLDPPRATPSASRESAQRLRALAHPLRWKLLDVLSAEGEVTATRCAQVLGESVASCAYHLGILGKYGYLERVPDVPGREKPWRAIDQVQDLGAVGSGAAERHASEAAVDTFMAHEFERMNAYRRRRREEESDEWQNAGGNGASTLWLTSEELAEIRDELFALLVRHRERGADPASRPAHARRSHLFVSAGVIPEP